MRLCNEENLWSGFCVGDLVTVNWDPVRVKLVAVVVVFSIKTEDVVVA